MNFTLKAIEEIKLSNTEEQIIKLISKQNGYETTLRYLGDNVNVIYATLCNELKKLILKNVLIVEGNVVKVTNFGVSIINYNKFKNKVLSDFCNSNKIDNETYSMFIENKNYNNMKLLLGIKNLLNN